jgi:hypothetical protein
MRTGFWGALALLSIIAIVAWETWKVGIKDQPMSTSDCFAIIGSLIILVIIFALETRDAKEVQGV